MRAEELRAIANQTPEGPAKDALRRAAAAYEELASWDPDKPRISRVHDRQYWSV